ncbi:MAG TPA: hypothetical protein PLL54_07730 [Dermatophilaceae bacterium]|nr:hypothetical protein [Dermatophilaceae bacterium]
MSASQAAAATGSAGGAGRDGTPAVTDALGAMGVAPDELPAVTAGADGALTDVPPPEAPVPAVEQPAAPAANTTTVAPAAIHFVTAPMSAGFRLQG